MATVVFVNVSLHFDSTQTRYSSPLERGQLQLEYGMIFDPMFSRT
jgi:hypothetical protein